MQATIPFYELIDNAARLNGSEFDRFLATVFLRRREQNGRVPSEREVFLLSKVYDQFAEEKRERIVFLTEKTHEFSISDAEYQELMGLLEESETFSANRLMILSELAQIRGVNYYILLNQLGLPIPNQDYEND